MKKVLGFDIDDTIANTIKASIPLLNEYFNKNFKVEEVEGRFSDFYGVEQSLMEDFYKEFSTTIFKNADTLPNSIETINKLYDNGHEIIIITARPKKESEEITEQWLREKGLKYHQLYFDEEKSQLAKDLGIGLFVDDYPKIVESMNNVGITSLLMDLPKNRKYNVSQGIYRVRNWNKVSLVIDYFISNGGK